MNKLNKHLDYYILDKYILFVIIIIIIVVLVIPVGIVFLKVEITTIFCLEEKIKHTFYSLKSC